MMGRARAFSLSGSGVISLVGAGGKTTLMYALARTLASADASVLITTTTKMRIPVADAVHSIIAASDRELLLRHARSGGSHPSIVLAAAASDPSKDKLIGFPPETVDALAASHRFRWILVEADGAAQRPVKVPASHEPVIPKSSGWVIGLLGLDVVGKPLEEAWVFRSALFSGITGLPMQKPISPASLAQVLAHSRGILKGSPPKAFRAAFLNKADTPKAQQSGREVADFLLGLNTATVHRVLVGRLKPEPTILESYDM